MTLRCKPGDVAVIIADDPLSPSPLAGLFVDVLSLAPAGGFALPDGYTSGSCGPDSWVIKFQRPVLVRTRGGSRMASYAACPDRYLRPIRADGVDESEVSALYLPSPEKIEEAESIKDHFAPLGTQAIRGSTGRTT